MQIDHEDMREEQFSYPVTLAFVLCFVAIQNEREVLCDRQTVSLVII